MKVKPKCYNQEEFELDNVYNDDDEMYRESSVSNFSYR